jgi:pilus assembly protein CpaC
VGQSATEQFSTPTYDPFVKGNAAPGDGPSKQTFSDFLNLFFFNNKYNLGTVITALQERGIFQSLAEPNLVAESGKPASFLAGGEIPVPIAQGTGSNIAITVQYKEFGIRLNFTPVVDGNQIHLKVQPEVSSLDFDNAIVLQGFRIPALSTRRTETELQLQSGQTFAIAGLLNNTMNSSLRKIPGIGNIPVLGLLFQSKAAQKNQTELVVMITPEVLPRNSSGVTPNLPRQAEPYLPSLPANKSIAPPPPPFRSTPGGAQNGAPSPAPSSKSSGETGSTSPAIDPSTPAATPATNDVASSPSSGQSPDAQRPATAQDQKALERAAKEERTRQEFERNMAKVEQERQAKVAREQAKRDAEAAKRAAEEAKKQLEAAKKQKQAVAEAEEKLKAAQAAYEAQVAKSKKTPQ